MTVLEKCGIIYIVSEGEIPFLADKLSFTIMEIGLTLESEFINHEGVSRSNYLTTTKFNALTQCITYTRHINKGKKYQIMHLNSEAFISFAVKLGKFEQYYYEQLIIDNLIENIVEQTAVDKREGWCLFQFTDEILDLLSVHFPTVLEFSTPLYRNPLTDKVDSRFKGKFYTKFVTDYFGHKTMLVRNEGVEKAFVYQSTGTRNIHQPFYFLQRKAFITDSIISSKMLTIAEFFALYNTTFAYVWKAIKERAEIILEKNIRF